MPQLKISNLRTGEPISTRVTIADNPWTRMKGLLGKRGLATDEGLIIRPCSSVHTYFMRFSLDVVFIDREWRVLKVVRDLQPFRFSGARGSRVVLELAAGALANADLLKGDRLLIEEVAAD
ncbi:MAG TPA: DUF192 domain-containing protein [Dehalococcoidia bacterium]|nr:DUF192 domain-containing protein [Dehalococcoidia bacterium]